MPSYRATHGFRDYSILIAAFGIYMAGSQILPKALGQQPTSKPPAQAPGQPVPISAPISNLDWQNRWLQWNWRTLVGDYLTAGFKHPKWDAPAGKALQTYARLMSGHSLDLHQLQMPHAAALDEAIQAGCNDPLIRYLHLRVRNNTPFKKLPTAQEYQEVATFMLRSGYSDVRKYFASLRAAVMVEALEKSDANRREALRFWGAATNHLHRLVTDTNAPSEALVECFDTLFTATRSNPEKFESYYRSLEPALFKLEGRSHVPLLIHGKFNILWAWAARGDGFADSVTKEGWKLFAERLGSAERALLRAWDMNPTDPLVPYEMLNVELGQAKGRARMDLWFNRAMKLAPNGYAICTRKLLYLEPKWHGSPDEMIAFGRECLASKEWGGSVPLILMQSHYSAAKYLADGGNAGAYWRKPAVWNEIEASYEKFGRTNPTALAEANAELAMFAYRCKHWEALQRILKQIGPVTDFTPFGTKLFFDEIAAAAEANARNK